MLLHKYSHVDNSQNYHYKYCSINPINSKFLQRASREQEGVVMGISTINSFLSYLSTWVLKKHLLTMMKELVLKGMVRVLVFWGIREGKASSSEFRDEVACGCR